MKSNGCVLEKSMITVIKAKQDREFPTCKGAPTFTLTQQKKEKIANAIDSVRHSPINTRGTLPC